MNGIACVRSSVVLLFDICEERINCVKSFFNFLYFQIFNKHGENKFRTYIFFISEKIDIFIVVYKYNFCIVVISFKKKKKTET